MADRPLEGFRVLDMSRILAGPWAGQYLADLGAEVIKVERAGAGDDARYYGPPYITHDDGSQSSENFFHLSCNRGKLSMTLDISKPGGQETVPRLAGESDVLFENYKVGDLKRYGLDFESQHKDFPA
ncbi:hypothetical protein GCM10011534_42680 [Pseudooceanicola nanhaiensis]|jgi:crotonobetainyl-CoA:carnitine CoA-transferase CaiB-like acyl-CoA transferase|uniref:CoA transferase n=1 Tax=Pseudooceanicola nanhaiensis TaxID=375761 RepID=A0A917TB16_9RHOB|nr:hypothetical protein GCM10011534_42680 [Pseudooceanicola nanhaiensis]